MKALFDPLVVQENDAGHAGGDLRRGQGEDETDDSAAEVEEPMEALRAPYRKKLYDDRVAMLPPATCRRSSESRKRYARCGTEDRGRLLPVLRIDRDKITEIEARGAIDKVLRTCKGDSARRRRGCRRFPAFWTVEVDPQRETETSYILTSGDPTGPRKDHKSSRAGRSRRRRSISEKAGSRRSPTGSPRRRIHCSPAWRSIASGSGISARGCKRRPSDFGVLGGTPTNPKLLDWLAAEFVQPQIQHEGHAPADGHVGDIQAGIGGRTRASPCKRKSRPGQTSTLALPPAASGSRADLGFDPRRGRDTRSGLGGPSFDIGPAGRPPRRPQAVNPTANAKTTNRRAAYMIRGYSTSRDVIPNFLQAFDVDDGRAPCPLRTQTVTAPQALFLMNSEEIEQGFREVRRAAEEGVAAETSTKAVDLAYRNRPSPAPPSSAGKRPGPRPILENDPERLKGFAWLIFNLDEFVYVTVTPMTRIRLPIPCGRVSRRGFLHQAGGGFLGVALGGAVGRGRRHPNARLGPRFQPKAKSVIFLFMCGGVSHIDTFDPKDNKWAGKMMDAVGFGDNVAEMKRPVIQCPHVHPLREIRHSGVRLVPARRQRDR